MRIPDEAALLALAEAAGMRGDSELHAAITGMYFDPSEYAGMIGELAEALAMQARQEGRELHPFLPSPDPSELAEGGAVVGSLPWYDEEVRIPLDGHVYLAAATRSGKTTLAELVIAQAYESGKRIVIFDPEGQFAADMGGMFRKGDLYVVGPDDYAVNPFEPPPQLSARRWIDWTANLEREAFFFRRGSENFANNAKLALLERGEPLTLRSFLAEVARSEPKRQNFREHGFWESVRTSAEGLLSSLPALGVSESRGLEEIFSRRAVIFDWSEVENHTHRRYLTMHAAMWLRAARTYEKERAADTLVVFDEVSQLASIDLQQSIDVAESFISVLARRAGKAGFTLMTIDQSPARTHPVVRGNAGTRIVMRLVEGRDKQVIAADLGLDASQREFLSALPARHALVSTPSFPQPVLCAVPEISRA